MQEVENALAELYQLSTNQNENAYVNPTVLVQDLQRVVEAEVSEEQLGKHFFILLSCLITLYQVWYLLFFFQVNSASLSSSNGRCHYKYKHYILLDLSFIY
mgnify:CR=1 FL=1